MRLPRLLTPLVHRDFRLLWTGQLISQVGSGIHAVALPFQILQLGGSPAQLGAVVALFTAAQLPLLLFGGAIVDRVPRRTVIMASEGAAGLGSAAVAVLGAAGLLHIEHLYAAAALFGAAGAFFLPAIGAITPELLPEDELVPGNALRSFSFQFGRVSGPVLGGLLVGTLGPSVAFAIDAVTYAVGVVLVAAIGARAVARRGAGGLLGEIREGLRFTFSITWLWVTIFLFALVVAGVIGPLAVALPILVRDVLHAGPQTFGAITATIGAGQIAGGALAGALRFRRTGLVMYLWAIASGVAILLVGVRPELPFVIGCAFALGVTMACFEVPWLTLLQRHVPREMLGRVTSIDFFGAQLLGPVAPVLTGLYVEARGPEAAFVAGGAAVAILCAAALLLPSIRRLE